jgi:outer membrane immunogenic protein
MKMKSALLGAVALVAMAGTAVAADLPVKAAPYVNTVSGPFSWTGFYMGVDAGYAFAAQDIGLSGTPVANLQEPGSIGTNASGGVGGLHGGFNYQVNPIWVWGIEGRFAATGLKSTGADTLGNTSSLSLPWEGSVVGRWGYVAEPRLMIYGLGGVAFGELKNGIVGANILGTANTDNVHTGWTAGAGIEYAFTNNLIGGLEYRYTNLGSTAITLCSVNGGCAVSNINVSQTAAWNEVLARLSVKF